MQCSQSPTTLPDILQIHAHLQASTWPVYLLLQLLPIGLVPCSKHHSLPVSLQNLASGHPHMNRILISKGSLSVPNTSWGQCGGTNL